MSIIAHLHLSCRETCVHSKSHFPNYTEPTEKPGRLAVKVRSCVDLAGHGVDIHLEALLRLLQHLLVFVCGNEGKGEALCTKSASTSDSMKVGVAVVWHVVVDDNVYAFNVNAAAEEV